MSRSALLIALALPLLLCSGAARADSEADQLRDQLRKTVLQLRELQDNQASAGAQQADATKQVDALKKELAAAKAKLRTGGDGRKLRDLQAQLAAAKASADQASQASQLTQAQLTQYKDAYAKAAEQVRDLTGERDRLQASLTRQNAVLASCQTKNVQLYVLSHQILEAYAKVGLGSVLITREPFLGLKRVQLENAVQRDEDKLYDSQCDLTPPPPAPPAPAAARP